ncbi:MULTISPECIES: hypothetical protein [Aeromicrobium]|uniref:hypothetical protein n=1 Tax=Aeromicrobium TaxID=2040 RepID=UPI0006F275A5|nr:MULTISPECIES: hypothetical protein [Aeromicrobium]KQX75885.1 hypothetical protein ASD10_12300 [Aeromicrobium sp. Root472D3]MCL8250526.1 hypothetical protein [Aeromicrobium fastidiosum]
MLHYWLRTYVRVIPFAAVAGVVAAVCFSITGDSSQALDAGLAAVGSAIGYVVARLGLRVIENKQAEAALHD